MTAGRFDPARPISYRPIGKDTDYGAGAVGGYFGAVLSRAGHEVAFIPVAATRGDPGVRAFDGRLPPGLRHGTPRRLVDLVLYCVKGYDNHTGSPDDRPRRR